MTDRTERSFNLHYGWVIIVLGGLTLFSCLGLARFAYGMLLPSMGKALRLGYDQMGFIGTGNFAGYLCAVAAAPFVIHRWGGRRTIASGLALLAACMIFIGFCHTFAPVLVLYFLTGIGSGFANIPMMVLVPYWFGRSRRGIAVGFMQIGTGMAIIFSGMIVPFLNHALGEAGWRTGWQVLGALSAAVAVAAGLLLRNSPAEMGLRPMGATDNPWDDPVDPPAKVRARGIVAHLGILYLLFGLTYMIYGTFIVTTMVSERGMAEVSAGRFWAWVGFFSIFSGMLFGTLSDRIGRKGGFMAVFAVQTLAYALAGAPVGMWALYLSVALYGISAWSIPTIMAAAVGDYLGPERAAAGFSAVTFFFAAGQTVGPSLAGIVAKHTGTFATSYLLSAAATAIAVLLAAFLRHPRPANRVPLRSTP
ncbi:MAG: MFS transporter [Acidobacteriota bacterium]